MSPPKYSFIIPTYNRAGELRELLPTLVNLTDSPSFELLVVDDGSTDETEDVVQLYSNQINLKYLHQKNQGPGAARNYGMRNAEGTYFIFVDSDCLLPEDYLVKIDQFIQKFSPDAFGGPDTFNDSFSPIQKAINYSMTSFLGTGGTRGSRKSVGRFYPRSFNMGLHRNVYEKIGNFNSLRHGQDMDYSARIYEAGFEVSLIPDAFVYHKRRTSLRKFFKQIYNWGVARINLSNIHKGLLKPIHLAPALIVTSGIIITMLTLADWLPMWILYIMIITALAVALVAFSQSLSIYRNLKVAILSVVTLFVQVLAYGLGTLSGLIQTHLFNKSEGKGFVKDYYK